MAELRVFVSSTCYDLSLLRSQLRHSIKAIGYDPIMSDYEDVLYDPRVHTHTSCVDEVGNCDILVLIIGSRFGGKASVESLNRINFDALENESLNVDVLKERECLSVTQLEVLKAIENAMPVYTFIDKRVWHDHALYEKNKSSDIIEKIIFPSIEKQETAKYIFDFINFVRLRTRGNNIFTFEKAQDIEDTLKKQWASYFQRLLNEQRFIEAERKRIDLLSEQFEDLKAAILSTISNVDQREIARGIVRFRRMFDFLISLKSLDMHYLIETADDWETILKKAGVKEILDASIVNGYTTGFRARTYLVKYDYTYYELRFSEDIIAELSLDWSSFVTINEKSREIIADTLSDISRGMMPMRYVQKDFRDLVTRNKLENSIEEASHISEKVIASK